MRAQDSCAEKTTRWSRTRMVRAAAAATAVAALAAGPGLAQAGKKRPAAKPDLVVKQGTLSVVKGRLVVSFKVKNTGTAKAGSSTASVSTVFGGKAVVLKKASVSSLAAGHSDSATAKVVLTTALATGAHEISVCADQAAKVSEKSEANNCLDLGTYSAGKIAPAVKPVPIAAPTDVPRATTPAPTPVPASGGPKPVINPVSTPTPTVAPIPTPTPAPVGPQPRPTSTVPTAPLPGFTQDDAATIGTGAQKYWIYVPSSYDDSGNTPIRLLVWMHGCFGQSEGEIYNASVGGDAQHYITIAPGGQEYGVDPGNGCWDVNTDPARVRAMIADVETHFNIDRRRIVLGGYSSGGDMAYRMAFDDAYDTAGVLIENSQPFGDSGLTSSAIGTAEWKFNGVHLAHTGDGTYLIDDVRSQISALQNAGFPFTLVERPGGHEDDNTDADMRAVLLPHMNDDWLAPAGP